MTAMGMSTLVPGLATLAAAHVDILQWRSADPSHSFCILAESFVEINEGSNYE